MNPICLDCHADEIWVSWGGLKFTHTVGSEKSWGLIVNHQAVDLWPMTLTFNPRPDTNMAKLAICVKDYFTKNRMSKSLGFLFVFCPILADQKSPLSISLNKYDRKDFSAQSPSNLWVKKTTRRML